MCCLPFRGELGEPGLDNNKGGALGRAKFESQFGLLLTSSVASARYLTPLIFEDDQRGCL